MRDYVINVQLYHGNLMLGSPSQRVVSEYADNEEIQKAVAEASHEQIDYARKRGLNMLMKGVYLRVEFERA